MGRESPGSPVVSLIPSSPEATGDGSTAIICPVLLSLGWRLSPRHVSMHVSLYVRNSACAGKQVCAQCLCMCANVRLFARISVSARTFQCVQAFKFLLKHMPRWRLWGGLNCVWVCAALLRGACHDSQSSALSGPAWSGLRPPFISSDSGCTHAARKCLPAAPMPPGSVCLRPRHGFADGHGLAWRSALGGPSSQAGGVGPGRGDPGAATAAGPAGPGAPGPGEAPHRGDPWRALGVSAPAEAQALGSGGQDRGPRAPALDPGLQLPRTLGYAWRTLLEGPGGGSDRSVLNGTQWVPEARGPLQPRSGGRDCGMNSDPGYWPLCYSSFVRSP